MKRRPPKNKKSVAETPKKESVLVVDGNALYKTGYHGAKSEFNASGNHIGGIFQFLTMLRKFLNENLYHKVYVFWDGELSGKLRYELYSDYKKSRGKDYVNGTRPVDDIEQILERLIVQEFLEELCVRQLEHRIVEADDFIAYYCKTRKDVDNITIVTNDRDLCQLIDDSVQIYLCDKKVYVTKQNYQMFFPHHQSNSVLVKVISGDSSDSIKGVKGVKETTLLKYFPEIGDTKVTLDEIINKSVQLLEERTKDKKKPLKALENIVNGVTDGVHKGRLYEVNQRLVDLSNPLLTDDAKEAVDNLIDGEMTLEGRGIKNAMLLMKKHGVDRLIQTYTEDYFMPFKKLIQRECK
jgi:5'-3' exonuclease